MKSSPLFALSLLSTLALLDVASAQERARPAPSDQLSLSPSDKDAAAAGLTQDQKAALLLTPGAEGIAVVLFSVAPPIRISVDLPPVLACGSIMMVQQVRPVDGDVMVKLPPLPFAYYLQPVLLVPGNVMPWLDKPLFVKPAKHDVAVAMPAVARPVLSQDDSQAQADAKQGK